MNTNKCAPFEALVNAVWVAEVYQTVGAPPKITARHTNGLKPPPPPGTPMQ
jgi:hypothetical protein